MDPKSDTIDAILRFNTSATPSFLAGFSNDELAHYLERLRDSVRREPGDTRRHPIVSDRPSSASSSGARRAG